MTGNSYKQGFAVLFSQNKVGVFLLVSKLCFMPLSKKLRSFEVTKNCGELRLRECNFKIEMKRLLVSVICVLNDCPTSY